MACILTFNLWGFVGLGQNYKSPHLFCKTFKTKRNLCLPLLQEYNGIFVENYSQIYFHFSINLSLWFGFPTNHLRLFDFTTPNKNIEHAHNFLEGRNLALFFLHPSLVTPHFFEIFPIPLLKINFRMLFGRCFHDVV